MPPANPLTKRLRDLPREQLAGLLARVPVLADALEGHGPLAGDSPYGLMYPTTRPTRSRTLERLATVLSTSMGIEACLASLDRSARDLVTLAVWHGGTLARGEALTAVAVRGEDPDAVAPRLDAAAAELTAVLLTDPAAGWVALRGDVARFAGLPGTPARPTLSVMRTDALGQILRNHGVADVPPRKPERVEALESVLRDGAAMDAAVRGLAEDARRVLVRLAADGPQAVRDLGLPYYQPWDRTRSPLRDLEALCLVGVDYAAQRCWVWLDVLVALEGGIVPGWPAPPATTPVALHDRGGLPEVLSHMTSLLSLWRAEPAPALAAGGMGVRPVRGAAKQLGLPAGTIGLLTTLAVELRLLDQVKVGTTGRGRAARPVYAWAPTALADDFAVRPAEERWALLVQAWHDAEDLDETVGLPERLEIADWSGGPVARASWLRLLAELPPGTGLAEDDLAAAAAHRYPALLRPPAALNVTVAARALGLVPPDGPIGLAALARALLDGPATLAAALPPPATSFVVQADLSVVAPPDLAPDLAAHLARYAELESTAGARLYRISEPRLAAALDAGELDEEIVGFLDAHTTAPLPQNVDYLVRDVARRHGRVRTGSCASYVRCDDPALLSQAIGVKAAKLRALAPTVAVSPLPCPKVAAALRARGLMPVPEDTDGVVLTSTPSAPVQTGGDLPALRARLRSDAAQARRLADDLLAGASVDLPQELPTGVPVSIWVDDEPGCDDDDLEDPQGWVDVDAALLAEGRAAIETLLAEVRRRGGERR